MAYQFSKWGGRGLRSGPNDVRAYGVMAPGGNLIEGVKFFGKGEEGWKDAKAKADAKAAELDSKRDFVKERQARWDRCSRYHRQFEEPRRHMGVWLKEYYARYAPRPPTSAGGVSR